MRSLSGTQKRASQSAFRKTVGLREDFPEEVMLRQGIERGMRVGNIEK